ncbi:hypothetical protein AB0B25_31255 [Nocardia sp. NPDC049190]|uniref:hypothetical protein n=1 Tax=Nocardia sp. NPDC049190 TaxID=3155650 RepID=UPI0033FF5D6D
MGCIGDLDVHKNLWGNGIATGGTGPPSPPAAGLQTSRHDLTAKSFWLLIAERTR